jgi:uncharacterized Rmd1/YagE family protein
MESMAFQFFDRLPMDKRPMDSDNRSFVDPLEDRIILSDDEAITKLPFSFALVQSVRLDSLQSSVDAIAKEVKVWHQHLNEHGKLICTLPQLRRTKTKLLSLLDTLNFKQSVQTAPKMFWSGEFQSLRGVYWETCEHLELEERAQALKAQLDTVDEWLSYLHDEVHTNMNEFLTWVIIILIASELFIALGILSHVRTLLEKALSAAVILTTGE